MGRLPRRLTDSVHDLPAGFVEYCRQNHIVILDVDTLIAELKKWKLQTAEVKP